MSDTKLPSDPSEMPVELFNSDIWCRNALVTGLEEFDCVDIHFEPDHAASECSGEVVGTWDVLIEKGRHRVAVSGNSLLNLLWYALEHANNFSNVDRQKREAIRSAALAKLTDDEKRVLGVRP
jgi:hypothetical protein